MADQRTCAECGYRTRTVSEYHPEAFCRMVKAGLDPWQVVRNAVVADLKLSGVKDLDRARAKLATPDYSRMIPKSAART